jgi:hypothetical protein
MPRERTYHVCGAVERLLMPVGEATAGPTAQRALAEPPYKHRQRGRGCGGEVCVAVRSCVPRLRCTRRATTANTVHEHGGTEVV